MTRPFSPAEATARVADDLGFLPEWNLGDLYPGMDSAAFADDLARVAEECAAFSADYKGKLDGLAREGGLLAAVKRYEAIDDRLGRIMSYAGLTYAGDTTDPARAKFYGDVQDKITKAATDLLFFQLELNRIDDAVLDAVGAGELAHYKPWLDDASKDKPYQLDDKLEQIFLEKSATGASAWNRLFDETMAAHPLRCRRRADAARAGAVPAAGPRRQDPRNRRQCARRRAEGQPAHLRADHQHARQGQGDRRPLAGLRRRGRRPPPLEPRRARGGRRPRHGGDGRLSAPLASLLQAQGQMVRRREHAALGSQRPAAQRADAHREMGRGPRKPCSTPMPASRRRWPASPSASSTRAGSTRRPGRARRRGRSRIPPCPPRIPTCC